MDTDQLTPVLWELVTKEASPETGNVFLAPVITLFTMKLVGLILIILGWAEVAVCVNEENFQESST